MALVQTEPVVFCYGEPTFAEAIGKFTLRWMGVGIIAVDDAPHSGNFPTVRLVGDENIVRDALWVAWNDGSSDEERQLWIDAMLGDTLALHRWQTACELGVGAHSRCCDG